MGIIPTVCFLIVLNGIFAQEDCRRACDSKIDDQAKNEACKEGCRLAVIFAIVSSNQGIDAIKQDCENGCKESYEKLSSSKDLNEACQVGCQSQRLPTYESVNLSITAKEPIYDVAKNAMFGKARDQFSMGSRLGFGAGFSDIDDTINQMRAMQEAMLRRHLGTMREVQRIFNSQSEENNEVAVHRPNGHIASSFDGPQVGNKDSNGANIINTKPEERPKVHKVHFAIFPAYQENYRVSRYQNPDEMTSFVERLSQRARRMSILSQWLICLALLLCLLSMVGISLAIIRQIKLQRRLRVRHSHMIIPTTIGQPLPAKKVPLESPAAAMDYPLIHDTPPPAYDQLSVHKQKVQEGQQS